MTQTAKAFEGVPFDNVLSCVHCGLCLDACPTYRELKTEQDSPRGRLYLMRALWEDELALSEDVAAPLSRCLDCRACETACPSAVPYGELLEKTRGVIAREMPATGKRRLLERFFFGTVLPSPTWTRLLSIGGLLYRGLGFRRLVTGPLAKWLPDWAVRGNQMMPRFAGRSFRASRAGNHRPASDEPIAKVGLFTGCIMDVADLAIHEATLELLTAAGCEVVIPRDQRCCGALHVHNGERVIPRALANRNRRAFTDDLDVIIVNAAGCGAQLREYAHLFSDSNQRDDAGWEAFGSRVTDILVFLAGLDGFIEKVQWKTEHHTVLYDAPCHLIHAQKTDAPRELLSSIPNLEVVPLTDASRCCGAAGIYNLLHGALADDILTRKLDDIEQTLAVNPDADTLVTGNPGCLFQIRAGCAARGIPLRVIHPAELIAGLINHEPS